MSKTGFRLLISLFSIVVVILLLSVFYLFSITQMEQYSVIAAGQKVNVSYFSPVTRVYSISYPGYISMKFSSNAPVLIRISFSYGGNNFTHTYAGMSGLEHFPVLPSKMSIAFYTASSDTNVTYTILLQF
ncbi:MAG: hypothetical protein J9259_05920 [Thermoplasmata archaeon YP2-bin.285]|uniref:Uncharacterized protein n=2 Tax=Candidatus Sysuiplasma superficiale TaxID=2823368 RepID=A0A8J8CFW8_9ARCH|nr:hypothetical protein [Candidatus Sysuiplasma superficiale]